MSWVEEYNEENENLSDHQKMTRKWAKLVRNKWNIAKDLIAPALPDLLKKYFQAELEFSCVLVWRHNSSLNLTGEFDILFVDSEENRLFLVQTSISPEKDDIIEFIEKIKIFRKLFPEYQDRVIVPIFAGIEMEKDVVDFATQNKMYALAYRDWEDLEILNFEALQQNKNNIEASLMNLNIKTAIQKAVEKEPFARLLNMQLVDLSSDFSAVEMTYDPARMDNIYRRTHGGAVYALIDEAFETVGQTDGTIAVALNVNVTYVASPTPGARLRAEARAVSRTRKTAGYDIRVTDGEGGLIATCQALAYRTGKPIPFLTEDGDNL